MEAKALHNFSASSPDELAFDKGDILRILDNLSDENWFKAENVNKTTGVLESGFIPANYVQMPPTDWLHGKIKRASAEAVLMGCKQTGAYLYRESESVAGTFSLSVKVVNQRSGPHIQHFKILKDDVGKYYLWSDKFASLNELTIFYQTHSVSRTEDIFLLYPVSRNGSAICPAPVSFIAPAANAAPMAAPAATAAPEPYNPTAVALYTFAPQEAGELPFKKNDIITVLDQTDENWWRGQCHGETGLFPANYVKLQ